MSAAFWVNLQWRYELEVAEDREAAKIARDVQPLEVS
jgi:plasmid maintenance system antidote protein VapI